MLFLLICIEVICLLILVLSNVVWGVMIVLEVMRIELMCFLCVRVVLIWLE